MTLAFFGFLASPGRNDVQLALLPRYPGSVVLKK